METAARAGVHAGDSDDRRGGAQPATHARRSVSCRPAEAGRSSGRTSVTRRNRRYENQEAGADNPDPARHRMVQARPAAADAGPAPAADRISAMNVHGNADGHIDALCRAPAADGGAAARPAASADAVTGAGATELSIAIAADGIRGQRCPGSMRHDLSRSGVVRLEPPWRPRDRVTTSSRDRAGPESPGSARVTSCSSGWATGWRAEGAACARDAAAAVLGAGAGTLRCACCRAAGAAAVPPVPRAA